MISAFNKNPKLILPGSGIRAEVLHPRQETPPPFNKLKFLARSFLVEFGQFTTFKMEKTPKWGFLAGSIKNGIMNLTIFMFYLSVSVYLFLSSQISYKFPDREGAGFSVVTKTMIS